MGICNCKNINIKSEIDFNKNLYLIEEMKLNLLIYNKIVINDDVNKILLKIFNNSKNNEELRILFYIYEYVCLFKDKTKLCKLEEKIKYKNGIIHQILYGSSLNTNSNYSNTNTSQHSLIFKSIK